MSLDLSLINSCLFNGLDEDTFQNAIDQSSFQKRSFKKDEIIALSQEKITGIYIIVTGSARGEMSDFDGKIIKIEDLETGRLLAPAFLFGKSTFYPVNIVANSNVETVYFQRHDFVKLMQKNETILMNYLNIISNRTQFLTEKIKFLSFQTIKQKLSHYLLTISNKSNIPLSSFKLPLSQEKLADLFGVTRPALARIISELRNDKIISTKGKIFTIIDKEKLQQLFRL